MKMQTAVSLRAEEKRLMKLDQKRIFDVNTTFKPRYSVFQGTGQNYRRLLILNCKG